MRIARALVCAGVAAATFAGSLVVASPAYAASSCNGTVSRQSQQNSSHFGSIPAVNGSTNCVLGVGNQGNAVRSLQFTLNRCFSAGLQTDGIFGNQTKTALQAAQRFVGTDDDGVYGPLTRNAFNSHRRWRTADDLGRTFCESVFL